MQLVVDVVHEAKRKLRNPYIIISGDFNQFQIEKSLEEHVDIKQAKTGNTRGVRCLDKVFTNFDKHIRNKGVVAPLQSEAGVNSDHMVAYIQASLSARPKTE